VKQIANSSNSLKIAKMRKLKIQPIVGSSYKLIARVTFLLFVFGKKLHQSTQLDERI
jgi:hypothetical protein